jgi:hypothetical protein
VSPAPVWKVMENLASTRIRSADRPARREWLHRLHCADAQYDGEQKKFFHSDLFLMACRGTLHHAQYNLSSVFRRVRKIAKSDY